MHSSILFVFSVSGLPNFATMVLYAASRATPSTFGPLASDVCAKAGTVKITNTNSSSEIDSFILSGVDIKLNGLQHADHKSEQGAEKLDSAKVFLCDRHHERF